MSVNKYNFYKRGILLIYKNRFLLLAFYSIISVLLCSVVSINLHKEGSQAGFPGKDTYLGCRFILSPGRLKYPHLQMKTYHSVLNRILNWKLNLRYKPPLLRSFFHGKWLLPVYSVSTQRYTCVQACRIHRYAYVCFFFSVLLLFPPHYTFILLHTGELILMNSQQYILNNILLEKLS